MSSDITTIAVLAAWARQYPDRAAAAAVLAGSEGLLLAALGFEYIGGYPPCALCHWQRAAHTVIALLAAGYLLVHFFRLSVPQSARRLGLCAVAVAGLASAGLALFHVGVEAGWWEGLPSCGGAIPSVDNLADLKQQLMRTPVIRCDEVAWRLFGLSMAGWNVFASLLLAAIALYGAVRVPCGNAGPAQPK